MTVYVEISPTKTRTWSLQQITRGDRGTSHGPALASYQDKLVMVWKGREDDPRIFYSIFDGNAWWSPQRLTRGDRGTSHSAALEVFQDKLFMAWKGKEDDPRIFYSYLYREI
jgi:predicted neuraminidase